MTLPPGVYLRRTELRNLVLSIVALLAACTIGEAPKGQDEKDAAAYFAEAQAALSRGDADDATEACDEVLKLDQAREYTCRCDYVYALAGVLDLVEEVDRILDLASLAGVAPGLNPTQAFNIDDIADSFLGAFERRFAAIREPANAVIKEYCTLMLPQGLPIDLGSPDGAFFVDATLGYEFDPAFLRAIVAGVEVAQALVDFVLAHRLNFDDDLAEAAEQILDALDALQTSEEKIAEGQATAQERSTWISVARAAGGLFDVSTSFLGFRDSTRMEAVDDDLERALRLIFYRQPDGSETGIFEDLFRQAGADTDVTDNMLAVIDNNKDGQLNAGDAILIGIRALDVESDQADTFLGFAVSDLGGGVQIKINRDAGNVPEALRLYKELTQALGDQMQAVEDSSVEWRRVGIADINQIAAVLNDDFEPIPEVLELDARAYFTDAKPLRNLVPLWYRDSTEPTAFDVFLIEGESAITTAAEPYVAGADVAHFPDSIMFGTLADAASFNEQEISNLAIDADGVWAGSKGFQTPFPYIAWQDPSFNGLIWLNLANSPVAAEGSSIFKLAEHYSINKVVNAVGVYYADQLDEVID